MTEMEWRIKMAVDCYWLYAPWSVGIFIGQLFTQKLDNVWILSPFIRVNIMMVAAVKELWLEGKYISPNGRHPIYYI